MNTKNFLTVLGKPDEFLCSQYGVVSYLDWCHHEVRRIGRSGGAAKVTEVGGLIAVERLS